MSHSAADEIDDDTLDPALRSESQELPLEERLQVEEASELPSDNLSEKKISKKKTKKYVSEMRNAYKSWYLDEAYEFFDPYSQNQDLRKSRIHKDGICKYLQNEDPKPRSREELSGIDDGASDSDLDFSDEEERRSGGYLQNQGPVSYTHLDVYKRQTISSSWSTSYSDIMIVMSSDVISKSHRL